MLIYSTYFVPKLDGSLPTDTVFPYQRSSILEWLGARHRQNKTKEKKILSHPASVARRSTRVPSTLAHLRAYLQLPEEMGVKQPRNLAAFAHFPRPTTLLACSALPPPTPPSAENNAALSPIPAVGATPEPHQTAQHSAATRYLGAWTHPPG